MSSFIIVLRMFIKQGNNIRFSREKKQGTYDTVLVPTLQFQQTLKIFKTRS